MAQFAEPPLFRPRPPPQNKSEYQTKTYLFLVTPKGRVKFVT